MTGDARRDGGSAAWPIVVVRLAFVLMVAVSLVAGIVGGLVRAGTTLSLHGAAWLGPAVASHAFLMIGTFIGTVIGIERAVALGRAWAFAGPVASGLGGVAMLMGASSTAAWLVAAASLAFVVVNAALVARQRAAHTVLLLVAALAWAAGSVAYALGAPAAAVVPAWFAFVVLTIAAERLEMTRLMRRRPGASMALHVIVAAMLLGAAVSLVASASWSTWAGGLFGVSLLALGSWLLRFDIAWRTVRTQALSRYMAVCLLLGHAWLMVAGAAWVAASFGAPSRDAALHALGLGFVLGMIFAHAPVILPAVAGVKVLYSRAFYVPLALLQVSLVVRLVGGGVDASMTALGAAGNAAAVLVFAATMVGSAIAWRVRHAQPVHDHHGIPASHR